MKITTLRIFLSIAILFVLTGVNATEQQLSNSVKRGRLVDVKKYLDQGFSQEIVDSAGRNLLLQSAVYRHLHLVDFFIGNRANIAKVDHKGNTVLHILAENTSPKAAGTIQLALKNGAYLGSKNYEGQTAVGKALLKGNTAAFRVFLEAGYDKNSLESNMPVVTYAYLKGRTPIVKALLDAGADINRPDAEGDTLLHHASSRNDAAMVKSLLGNKVQINVKNAQGKTALMLALEKNRIPIAETLIKSGADVNITDRQKRNILHYIAPILQANKLITMISTDGLNIDARDDGGNTPLIIAAEKARWNNVDLFASRGADVNVSNREGQTPLLLAAGKGTLTAVKSLIDKGADVKKANNSGQTLLHLMASNKNKAAIPLLSDAISRGAQVNAKTVSGETPSGLAVASGNLPVFSVFLEAGADKNALEGNTTPLPMFAYEKKRRDISKTLLDKGADVKKSSTDGKTILHSAASLDDWQFLNILFDYNPDINAKDVNGITPLLSAIDKSAIRSAGILIEKGADVNVKDKMGRNAIHYLAAARNATGLLAKLQGEGIAVDVKDSTGRTPLATAVESNRVDNVEYLINIGANVNGRDHNGVDLVMAAYGKSRAMLNLFITRGAKLDVRAPDGKTLLLLGLEKNDTSLIQLLTEKGANVNEKQANDQYPLEFAVERKQFNNAKILLDVNADFRIRDTKGNPLLSLAIEKKTHTITGLLLQKGADPNGRNTVGRNHLFQSLDENQPLIFKQLVDFNADINSKDGSGTPLLVLAAEKNRSNFIQYIFEKNVSLNAVDSNSNTALIVASWKGYYNPVKLIAEKGADINFKGQDGESALFKAIYAPGRTGVAIINLLAKHGCDVKTVASNGDSVLHRSIRERKLDLFELYLKLGADPNVANKNGDTLLMQLSGIDAPSGKGAVLNKMAAENRTSIKLIQTLLKNGADPNVMNRYGNFALNMSRVKRNYDIVSALLERRCAGKSPG